MAVAIAMTIVSTVALARAWMMTLRSHQGNFNAIAGIILATVKRTTASARRNNDDGNLGKQL